MIKAYSTYAKVSRYPLSNKKRTSNIRGSLVLPEFVPKNQGFSIWRNAFGAKNGAQAKRRIEAYLTYARVAVIAQQLVFSPKAFAKSGSATAVFVSAIAAGAALAVKHIRVGMAFGASQGAGHCEILFLFLRSGGRKRQFRLQGGALNRF